jgi:hypothetical protein
MKIEPRQFRNQGRYGWSPGKAWWDYIHPSYPSGPDKNGWGDFITCHIWQVGGEFLAISGGCHWIEQDGKTDRAWSPSYALCTSLEAAMDFCEADMIARGTLPPWPR